MDPTDERILDLLAECDGDAHAVAETLCDGEVARGEYEGCSSDLELAFAEYQGRAERLLAAAGGR